MRKFPSALIGCSLLAGLLAGGAVAAAPASACQSGPSLPGAWVPDGPVHRIVDTRTGTGAARQPVAPGHTLIFSTSSLGGAVELDVAVPGSFRAGSISVFPGDARWDGRVSLPLAGDHLQQVFTVGTSTTRTVAIRNNASVPIDLVVDELATYISGPVQDGGMFVGLNRRLADTRLGTGTAKRQIGRASCRERV